MIDHISKITIPMVYKVSTNSIYSGMHWTKRKKITELFHTIVRNELIRKNKQKIKEPVYFVFIFKFKSRPLDVDNCTFMGKCCLDGYKGILIEDDGFKQIKDVSYHTRNEIDIFVYSKKDIAFAFE